MTDTFDALFRDLLIGEIWHLRDRLRPLSETERASLFKRFNPILTSLRRIADSEKELIKRLLGVDFQRMYFRAIDLQALYQQSRNDPDGFFQSDWLRKFPRVRADGNASDVLDFSFFKRIQGLHVGLSDKRSIRIGMKKPKSFFRDSQPSFVSTIGHILLDRPEAWK